MPITFARRSTRIAVWSALQIACVFVCAGRMTAQRAFGTPGGARMDIHPQSMTLGTTNPAAGEYPVGTDGNAMVSVSPQCVGTHRCPLFLFLPGGGQPAQHIITWLRPVADKYGMLAMSITNYDPAQVQSALTEVLQHYAVDRTRIAVIGRCASGGAGMRFGIDNPDVFSRIALISGEAPPSGPETAAQKSVEVLLDVGVMESQSAFLAEEKWRADGHPVKTLIGMRGHEDQVEDYDFLGRWLTDSWAHPNPATRVQPHVFTDVPVLTTDALKKMTTFWTLFSREPDSVFITARRAHLHEVVVPVGRQRTSLYLVDMPALAKQVPSVAAALKQAGLTAQEHDTYRAALISAWIVSSPLVDGEHDDSVNSQKLYGDLGTSTLSRNITFLDSHPEEMKALAQAGMTHAEKIEDPELGGAAPFLPPGMPAMPHMRMSYPRTSPNAVDKDYGPMGIWRTP